MNKKKNVVVLGSTGSIGSNAVWLLSEYSDRFTTVGLVACNSIDKLANQGEMLNSKWIASTCEQKNNELKTLSNRAINSVENLSELICADEVDIVVCAIVGTAGLPLVMAALEAGKHVALASKEVLVTAGDLVMAKIAQGSGSLIPVDSEHSAIFQCLHQRDKSEVSKLILTASGGAFRQYSVEQIARATVADALAHPTWQMGPKVTIDSATLMNKALEFVEAGYMFGFEADKIDVLIHPQSIVHSLLEFCDGSMLAQLSTPDMRFAIGYGMSYPDRLCGRELERLSIETLSKLEFSGVDSAIFPSLEFAKEALRQGGSLPAVMNAANEVAVDRFIAGEVSVPEIWRIVEKSMSSHQTVQLESLDSV